MKVMPGSSRHLFTLGLLAVVLGVSPAAAYDLDYVLGPVTPVYAPSSTTPGEYYNSGWFPDAHFPLLWGGPNNPSVNLSFWIPEKMGSSMDDMQTVPGAGWIPSGAYGSGDYRGYWVSSVIRPSDYQPALLGTTVNLTIYTTDNSSSSIVSHTIDANYLIGFCHVEDYDSSGNVVNRTRTIYSFNNGFSWNKGPFNTAMTVAVDNITTPGSPRLISVGQKSLGTSSDLAAGAVWTHTTTSFNPGNFAYTNSLFYNRYLGLWAICYVTWGSTDTSVHVAVSSDLLTWQSATSSIVLNGTLPAGAANGSGNYQTILGSLPSGTTAGNYETQTGQLAWLYNNIGGLGGRAVSFIHPARQDITWTGSGNMNTAGNWTLTAGGAFSGFTDEAQSLTFSSGSGSPNNDIPTTIRTRGLVFGTGAGSYTFGGNKLELEAYAYGSTKIWSSIDNFSTSTQTFNTGIDVRSAALYLNASAGPLIVNGAIDMLGSGGILVYGTANTTLNGVISDSGYHDFASGNPEFIADSNEGRLIKQDTSTLTLGGANTFAGRTDILGGVITTTDANALQNSVVTFNADNALVLGTNSKLGGLNGIGNLSLTGLSLTLGNNNPVNCYATRYSGIISGSGGLTKTQGNTQRIGAINTYTGGTTLSGGVLEIPGSYNTALGSGAINFNGGSLKALGPVALNNAIVLGSGGASILSNGNAVTLSGNVSGTGALVTDSAGSLTLSGTNSYSGGTTIRNAVQVATSGALGTGAFSLQGGTLQITNNINLGGEGINVATTRSAIDTGSFTLTSTGSITVAAGQTFLKQGTGTFQWSGSGTAFNGDFDIDQGTVADTSNGTYTFTNGNIILGGSTLFFQPAGSGGNIVVNLAQTSGKALVIAGLGDLALDCGSNNSLVINVGSAGNPNALVTSTSSIFLMTPASGTAALGSSPGVEVLVPGTAATTAGSIFPPNFLATSGVDGQADFVTYNTTNGFTAFTGYTTRTGTYSQTLTTSTEIPNVASAATLSANSYAQGLRISGTTTLNLNSKTYTMNGAGAMAGVILNSGTLTGGTLAFGTNHGYIYSNSKTAATITSVISGSGGVTVLGMPGSVLKLTANNTYTGNLIVEGVTCNVTGSLGMGAAANSATIDGQGVLSMPYSTTTGRNYIIGSGGGSLDVPGSYVLNMSNPLTGPGDWHKTGTGSLTLNGNNTFGGSVYVDAGTLAFNGRTTFFGTNGTITVANGACFKAWTWGSGSTVITNDFVLNGSGIGGNGALLFNGGGTLAGSITLAGNALIATISDAGTFTGAIVSPGYNLTMSAATAGTPYQLNGSMSLGSGTLTVAGAGGLIANSTASIGLTGPIIVSSGAWLTVKGTIDGTSGVTDGGTLCGYGDIGTTGAIEVTSGGVLFAGTGSTPGVLTARGDFSLDAGAEYQSYVNNAGASTSGSSGYGQLVVLGSGTLTGNLRLYRNAAYTPQHGDQLYVALRNGGSGAFGSVIVVDGGASTSYSGAPGSAVLIAGVTGTITYNAQSSQALTSGSHDVVIQF